mmetsp:Transcript_22197/g.25415  ORF Transcript_22197/g.25415 Transcript_22197/m.25415 type:complete len:232 (+) Transcript_22197:289-984(+)
MFLLADNSRRRHTDCGHQVSSAVRYHLHSRRYGRLNPARHLRFGYATHESRHLILSPFHPTLTSYHNAVPPWVHFWPRPFPPYPPSYGRWAIVYTFHAVCHHLPYSPGLFQRHPRHPATSVNSSVFVSRKNSREWLVNFRHPPWASVWPDASQYSNWTIPIPVWPTGSREQSVDRHGLFYGTSHNLTPKSSSLSDAIPRLVGHVRLIFRPGRRPYRYPSSVRHGLDIQNFG